MCSFYASCAARDACTALLVKVSEVVVWCDQGREDLRLDERLMQLLRCSNAVLRSSSTSSSRQLHVPTFGVIPLGTRTGLIEWVDHTVPLFGIYQNSRRHSMLAAGDSATSIPVLLLLRFLSHHTSVTLNFLPPA